MIYTDHKEQWNKESACTLTREQVYGLLNVANVVSRIASATTLHPIAVLRVVMQDEGIATTAYNADNNVNEIAEDIIATCFTDIPSEDNEGINRNNDSKLPGFIWSEILSLLYFAVSNEYGYDELIQTCDKYNVWLYLMAHGRPMGMGDTKQNANQIRSWIAAVDSERVQ